MIGDVLLDKPANWGLGALCFQVGAGFLALGLATCDIVAAIESGSDGRSSRRQLEQFGQAARTQDFAKMVQLLKAGGVPDDLAQRTARSVMDDPDGSRI